MDRYPFLSDPSLRGKCIIVWEASSTKKEVIHLDCNRVAVETVAGIFPEAVVAMVRLMRVRVVRSTPAFGDYRSRFHALLFPPSSSRQ